MKNLKTTFLFAFLLLFVCRAGSTTRTVQAAGFSFTPASLNANVGDTVKWVWVSGIHTTTSTTIPSGAVSWDAPLDVNNTSYTYVITQPGHYDYICFFHQTFGMVGEINAAPSGIKPAGTTIPETFALEQNFPNPFNPSTNIRFDIPKPSEVELSVYNLIGELQAVLYSGTLDAGIYTADWDASEFPSGVYLYILRTREFSESKRMVLIK